MFSFILLLLNKQPVSASLTSSRAGGGSLRPGPLVPPGSAPRAKPRFPPSWVGAEVLAALGLPLLWAAWSLGSGRPSPSALE